MIFKLSKKNIVTIVLLLIFSFIFSLNVLVSYSTLNNTIDKNSNWISSKYDLGRPIIGGGEYIWETQALSKNRLDLSAWYGYNELLSKNFFKPSIVEFDFFLDEGQYFYFVFNKNINDSTMLRFSNSQDFPSAHLTVKESGEFSSQELINLNNYISKKWYHVIIKQINENNISIKVGEKEEIIINNKFLSDSQIGFRGPQYRVLIDNVYIKDAKYNNIFIENFNYKYNNLLQNIFFLVIFFFVFQLFIIYVLYILKNKFIKNLSKKILIYNVLIVFITVLLNYYLINIISPSYLNSNSFVNIVRNYLNKIDGYIPFESDYPSINLFKGIFEEYKPENKDKIFFIGTSQTWGAGAKNISDTMVNIFDSKIKNEISQDKYQVVNIALPGSKSKELLFYYKNYWLKTPPKIVVINLSNNDLDYEVFYNNLSEFIKINKEYNIKTVLVLEANSFEENPNSLMNHKAVSEIANFENLLLIDLHQFLKDKKDSGIIWWDFVHPTNYGYKISGEYIFDNMKEIL